MASQIARALPNHVSFFKGESLEDELRAVRLLRKKQKLKSVSPFQRQKTVNGNFRRRLRPAGKALKAEQTKYRKLSASFLAKPENKWCLCCTIRREVLKENIVRNQATIVHHWAGRIGRLLCYVRYFKAFCWSCATWPHDHPSKARELNLLAPAHLWNMFPGDY